MEAVLTIPRISAVTDPLHTISSLPPFARHTPDLARRMTDDVTSSQRKITVWRVQKCCSWAWTSPTIQAGSGLATFEDRRRIDQEEGARSIYGEVSTPECGRGAMYLHPHHPRSFRRFLHSYTFPPVVIECTLVREERDTSSWAVYFEGWRRHLSDTRNNTHVSIP